MSLKVKLTAIEGVKMLDVDISEFESQAPHSQPNKAVN